MSPGKESKNVNSGFVLSDFICISVPVQNGLIIFVHWLILYRFRFKDDWQSNAWKCILKNNNFTTKYTTTAWISAAS